MPRLVAGPGFGWFLWRRKVRKELTLENPMLASTPSKFHSLPECRILHPR
jgi:hypothetical protein